MCYIVCAFVSFTTKSYSEIRMLHMRCVYDIDHMYALRIQNTSERASDLHSYEATKAVTKKTQKHSEVSTDFFATAVVAS